VSPRKAKKSSGDSRGIYIGSHLSPAEEAALRASGFCPRYKIGKSSELSSRSRQHATSGLRVFSLSLTVFEDKIEKELHAKFSHKMVPHANGSKSEIFALDQNDLNEVQAFVRDRDSYWHKQSYAPVAGIESCDPAYKALADKMAILDPDDQASRDALLKDLFSLAKIAWPIQVHLSDEIYDEFADSPCPVCPKWSGKRSNKEGWPFKKVAIRTKTSETLECGHVIAREGGFQGRKVEFLEHVKDKSIELDEPLFLSMDRHANTYGSGGFQGGIRRLLGHITAALGLPTLPDMAKAKRAKKAKKAKEAQGA